MPVPEVIGRYRLGPRLGSGGFAVVWLAHDESLDTDIAIKVMAENWADRMDLRERSLLPALRLCWLQPNPSPDRQLQLP